MYKGLKDREWILPPTPLNDESDPLLSYVQRGNAATPWSQKEHSKQELKMVELPALTFLLR